MKAERLYTEFREWSVPVADDRLLLRADDAVSLIGEAADEGVPVVGITGARVHAGRAEETAEHRADFSASVAEGHGCWAEAEAWVRARARDDLAFAIALGGDPLELV